MGRKRKQVCFVFKKNCADCGDRFTPSGKWGKKCKKCKEISFKKSNLKKRETSKRKREEARY